MQSRKEGCGRWLGEGFWYDLGGDLLAMSKRMFPEIALKELQNRMKNAETTGQRMAVLSDIVVDSSMVEIVEGREAMVFGVRRASVARNHFGAVIREKAGLNVEIVEAYMFLGVPDGEGNPGGISRRKDKALAVRSDNQDWSYYLVYHPNRGELAAYRQSAKGNFELSWRGKAEEFDLDEGNRDIGERFKSVFEAIGIERLK